MKKYEKPILVALSLNGNERLCGECALKDKKIASDEGLLRALGILFGGSDLTLTEDEFDSKNIFGNVEECAGIVVGYESYCKFNGASAYTIAWS